MFHFQTYRNLVTPQLNKGIYKPCLLSLYGSNLFSWLSFHQLRFCRDHFALSECVFPSPWRLICSLLTAFSALCLQGKFLATCYSYPCSKSAALTCPLATKSLPLLCPPGKAPVSITTCRSCLTQVPVLPGHKDTTQINHFMLQVACSNVSAPIKTDLRIAVSVLEKKKNNVIFRKHYGGQKTAAKNGDRAMR